MIDDIELLRLIENNARLSSAEIATMLGSSEDEVNSLAGGNANGRVQR